jgi:hypothetical protein
MAANSGTFEAVIGTVDHASAPLRAITERIAGMTRQTVEAEEQMRRLDRPMMFQALSAQLRTLSGRFGSLGESIGNVHSKLSSLVPALAGLGGIASVAGVFKLVDATAEATADKVARMQRVGVNPKFLGPLTVAAKAARVEVDSLDTFLIKMQRNMFDAASGKNKDVAELFKYLNMPLKDKNGIRDAGEVMTQFFDVIQKTTNGALREKIVNALGGKGGADLLKLFETPKAVLEEIKRETAGLNYSPSPTEIADLQSYTREQMYLKMAVQGVRNELGVKLEPVLKPIIVMMRQWIAANRDWIVQKVDEKVRAVTDALKQINWANIGRDIDFLGKALWSGVEAVGGFDRVIEIMIAWKVGTWALGFARGLVRIGLEAKAVGTALLGMRDAALAADSVAFGGMLGRLAMIAGRLSAIGAMIAILWPTSTAKPELDEAPKDPKTPHNDSAKLSRLIYERRNAPNWSWSLTGPKPESTTGPLPAPSINFTLPSTMPTVALPNGLPTLGPVFGPQLPAGVPALPNGLPAAAPARPSAMPTLGPLFGPQLPVGAPVLPASLPPVAAPAAPQGQVRVKIDIANLPSGSRVSTTGTGIADAPETSVGYADPLALHF